MSKNLKLSIALVVAFVVPLGVFAAVSATRSDRSGTTDDAVALESSSQVVRDDSHRLSVAEDGKVTLVEFLDFECEACGAVYPFVEQLREEYDGRVTFVARYFPLPGHANGQNAALAVEAAAQQDQFEAMYQRMYETQSEWGEQQESKADLFRTFAEDLGLDLDAYDTAIADTATLERVQKDMDDGLALGVQSTPTFFLNGEQIQPATTDEFKALIDDALED